MTTSSAPWKARGGQGAGESGDSGGRPRDPLAGRPVVLTGATGFLGRHLVDALVAAGLAVRAVVRGSSDTRWLAARGVPCVVADLMTSEGLPAALDGAGAVIHAAGGGLVHRPQDLARDNRDVTATLVRSVVDNLSAAAPLGRFILLSSLSARGPARTPAADTAPVSAYGRAKRDAEAALAPLAGQVPTTIFRPPAVYGPADTRLLPVFRAARRGWVPLAGGDRPTSLVFGPDCARAVVLALLRDHPDGAIYTPEDGGLRTMEALVRGIGVAVGGGTRTFRVPDGVVRAAGALAELGARVSGRATALHRDKIRDVLATGWVCDAGPLAAELGWQPATGLDDGLAQTARWYRDEGWL